MTDSRFTRAAVLGVSLVLAGCNSAPTVCGGVGLVRTLPADTMITVGQSVALRHQEGGTCFPGHPSESDYVDMEARWTTPDSAVVQVDSLTGRVTGRAVGDARVDGRGVTGGIPNGFQWPGVVHVR